MMNETSHMLRSARYTHFGNTGGSEKGEIEKVEWMDRKRNRVS